MQDEPKKRGPKPFPWNPDAGEVKTEGHSLPSKCHKLMRKDTTKTVIQKMALEPEFEVLLVEMAEKPADKG